jgi:hypothetical protein
MKKALISPQEVRETGYRVAQVVTLGQEFEVGAPLFWVDCSDNIVADQFWYDPVSSSIKILPSAIVVIDKDQTDPTKALVYTSYPHNLITGNSVNMMNQLPIEYVGTYNVTVIDANSFSYIMENEPATNATNVGTYDVLD